jgi:cell division septal protein FtsQ
MRAIMSSGHQKKERDKSRALTKFLMVAVLVSVMLALVTMSPVFRIRGIGVHGNNHYTIQEVVNASGVKKGQNGFLYVGGGAIEIISLRCGDAEKKIKEVLPYTEEVIVKYIIPDMMVIELTERKPALIVPYMTAYLLVDGKGNVLDSIKEAKGYGLPVARGIKVKSFKLGQPLVMENENMFGSIVELIKAIQQSDVISERKILDSIEHFEVSGDEIHFLVDSRITGKIRCHKNG